MKLISKYLLASCCILCLGSTSFAQNRTIGANKLLLDDGLGHTLTLQPPSPTATGTLTLPAGNANIANMANGTITGQTARWNNATSQWEVSPSVTNVGSTLVNSGPITTLGGSGNISASGTVSAAGNVTATGNVTSSGYHQPGVAVGSGTPVNGGLYTDNMIQAAGATDINGAPYVQVGNYTITHPSTGHYTITFPYGCPNFPIVISQAGTYPISTFFLTLNPLVITVNEYFPDAVTPVNGGFNFIVIGPHN